MGPGQPPLPTTFLPLQVAFVGFAVQALVNRMGPIEALTTHLGNPGRNITYYLTHCERPPGELRRGWAVLLLGTVCRFLWGGKGLVRGEGAACERCWRCPASCTPTLMARPAVLLLLQCPRPWPSKLLSADSYSLAPRLAAARGGRARPRPHVLQLAAGRAWAGGGASVVLCPTCRGNCLE